MNSAQINKLALAIANLIAAALEAAPGIKPDSIVATAPKSPTHIAPKAPAKVAGAQTVKTPAAKPAAVKATKKTAAKPAAVVEGLIDISTLTGLVKARAVAANNRFLAKQAEAAQKTN